MDHTTASHIDRAAEIIYVEVLGLPDYSPDAVDDHNRHSYRGDCECNSSDRVDARHAAEKLDAAGLFVTSRHETATAAEALREAADEFAAEAHVMERWTRGLVAARLRDRAHLIEWGEREAGESGA